MYQKTCYFQRSFLRETSEGLTMGGCINKHGGLKTSYAWPARFMSRLYGKRWQLLSFNTSAAAKSWHRDILTHLRPCTCSWNIRFRHPAGTSPPAPWSSVQAAIVLRSWMQLTGPRCCLIYVLGDSFSATFPSVSPTAAARLHSRPSGNTLWWPWTLGCPPVLVQISICEWNPARNKPSAPSSVL